jgi:TPR repeat protein
VAYARGEGVQQDYMKALEFTSKAADKGHRDAQAFLGALYLEGSGVQQDYKKAEKWFIKAAEQGAVQAQTNLGAMYAQGLGVQQNTQKAVEWLTKAAEQGDMDAQFNLGVIYTRQRDYKKAYELYFPIAFQGHANAQNMLGEMFFNGDGVEQDFEQAAAYFMKAAEQGNAIALRNLQEIRNLFGGR